ncbi:MAG: bifunctional alpha,alpha-trehalose-phosphate synthase (UDP-forming)/trehalose-phosphatase [Candidatus Saccharimonadales bacterium]
MPQQIIIVSNRLPVSVKKENGKLMFFPSVGGLATGLSSYVNDKSSIWIGWPGIASDEITERERDEIVTELAKHNCSPVFLTKKQIDDFYNGYSNTVLWPLFHELRPMDKPGEQRDKWYKSYHAVNKLFAETVEVAAGNDVRIWVHDYQLLLVPEMLRAMKMDVTIGFFLHIPFPDSKKFTRLSDYRKIIKGVLGADLIGFHTPDYVENFLKTCTQNGLGTVGEQTLTYEERVIRVSDFPMGIDYEKYAFAGKTKLVKQTVKQYHKKYHHKKVIVAVDRLDPSKGLIERLNAYRMFLQQYPKLGRKSVFVMVAAPSRTDVPAYQRLSKRLNQLASDINAEFGNDTWQPIEYINSTIPFEEVTALFQIADVAFIAPLRDGMNLAAKEFVASSHKDSVLILSETAGASQELSDALIVNPRNTDEVVDALYSSLTMRRRELRKRLKNMKQYLKDNTVQTWAMNFINTLQPIGTIPIMTRALVNRNYQELVNAYQASQKRLLLLDYDGSLVPFNGDYKQAKPPKSLLDLLDTLGKDSATDVVVISGRSSEDLESWFGKLPVSLVAEHGASFKQFDMSEWHSYEKLGGEWKELLRPVLEKYALLAPGSRVEEKSYALVWHYRPVAPYYAQKYRVIIKRVLKPFLKNYGLEIISGNKILEIKNPRVSKGRAAGFWLTRDYDFIIGVGDDTTDEELFLALPETAYSIKVGRGMTNARYRVDSYRDVLKALRKLADS